MEKDIIDLFEDVDEDKSGTMEIHELGKALSYIGINAGPIELHEYFKKFD